MKKSGILNAQLLCELTKLRHKDKLLICDAGFPIPAGGNVVDISLVAGLPSLPQTLQAVVQELIFEDYAVMSAMPEKNPEYYRLVTELFQAQSHVEVPMDEFIALAQDVKLFIRTGELRPASNLMLTSASGTKPAVERYNVTLEQLPDNL
mgnify:CR=1 FL=1